MALQTGWELFFSLTHISFQPWIETSVPGSQSKTYASSRVLLLARAGAWATALLYLEAPFAAQSPGWCQCQRKPLAITLHPLATQ